MNPIDSSLHEPLLVNLSGHSAGAIIFGTFLYLLLKSRKADTTLPGSWAAITAASLALLWNVGSLSFLVGLSTGWSGTEWLAAFTLCSLSALPAVLFRLSLDQDLRPLTVAGYVMSLAAVSMQLESVAFHRPDDRARALLLITAGFGVLTTVSAGLLFFKPGAGKRRRLSRIVGSMCLFLLAMSFVHLGSGRPLQTWSRELALHHCGIPLALFILLQDYRFVLIDALIRFLVNYLLAAGVALASVNGAIAAGIIAPLRQNSAVILILAVSLVLIGFAIFRGLVQRWLTRVIFRRPGIETVRSRFKDLAARSSDEASFLESAASEVADFSKAERFSVSRDNAGAGQFPRWVEESLPLRFSQGDSVTILFGRRRGGRRYLSEDHEALNRLGGFVVEEVGRLRDAEVQRLVSGAELRALQSQINPHFLFNSFNALYGIIPRESGIARRTVLNLTTIFRYLLQSPQTFVRVADEMQIVEAYLEIEKLRLGSRLQVELDIDKETSDCRIPTLSIQPLVENAVKHGVASTSAPGSIRVRTSREDSRLTVTVENTCPSHPTSPSQSTSGAGIGLANVRRRLQLCFGSDSCLSFELKGREAKASFSVPAQVSVVQTL